MQRIFVTGGASGLGLAIAKYFSLNGWRVAIGDIHDARGSAALPALGRHALYLHCDVTQDADLTSARERLEHAWGGVDVVVNNAGVAAAGPIEDLTLADWQWIIDINLLGVVRGCRTFVPLLKAQGGGHIVNVASMAGLIDVPFMSSYNATKAAVVSLSETLQNELAANNIGVSVVCPSFVKTNLTESIRTPDPRFATMMARLLDKGGLTADDVARDVYGAVRDKRFYVLSHLEGNLAWRLKRFLPRGLYASIIRQRAEKMKRV